MRPDSREQLEVILKHNKFVLNEISGIWELRADNGVMIKFFSDIWLDSGMPAYVMMKRFGLLPPTPITRNLEDLDKLVQAQI